MKSVFIRVALISLLLISGALRAATDRESGRTESSDAADRKVRILMTWPERREGNYREENLNDIEVRQIQRATREVLPGAIVNIGGVVSGCHCEDGPDCSAQVWVVAAQPEQSRGMSLSRIAGAWVIGPVQRWWLKYESLFAALRATFRDKSGQGPEHRARLQEQLAQHEETFPACIEVTDSTPGFE